MSCKGPSFDWIFWNNSLGLVIESVFLRCSQRHTFFTRAGGVGSIVLADRFKVAWEVRTFERLPALNNTDTSAFFFFAGGSIEGFGLGLGLGLGLGSGSGSGLWLGLGRTNQEETWSTSDFWNGECISARFCFGTDRFQVSSPMAANIE